MRELIYCMLHEAAPVGRTIGRFADRDISEVVRDQFGREYLYVGLACRTVRGDLDPDALAPGEFILAPGLIYRVLPGERRSWRALWPNGLIETFKTPFWWDGHRQGLSRGLCQDDRESQYGKARALQVSGDQAGETWKYRSKLTYLMLQLWRDPTNYNASSADYRSPYRANDTGVLNSVLNVIAFLSLIAFGIVTSYWYG